jgi:hypothetical protein
MSLPVAGGGRAPARHPILIESTRADSSGSPADMLRALRGLERDLIETQEDFIDFWARSIDFLLVVAMDTIIDSTEQATMGAPTLRVVTRGPKPALGAHRIPKKPRLSIRPISPRPDPVSGADITAAIEQLRTNLLLRMKQSADSDQKRTQMMAEMLMAYRAE